MNGTKEFLEAVKAGDLPVVRNRIESDSSLVNARNETGASAILLATYYGRKEVAELLIARGARLDIFEASAVGEKARVTALLEGDPGSVNSYSHDGFTPLGLAAFFGHRDIVDVLLAHGADVNAVSRNATGYTALTGAVAHGHREIAAALLAAGANVNHRYVQGYSPLHEAAANNDPQMVKLLLDHGGDPNARMDDCRTPLALALEKGHEHVAGLLRQHGATE